MKLRIYLVFILCLSMAACTAIGSKNKVVAADPDDAGISRFAKSDINEVTEHHQRAVMLSLKQLMIKLYRRNPTGRHDIKTRTIEESVAHVFAQPHHVGFVQWQDIKPNDIVRIALDETYQGSDRVLPFIFAIRKMIMAAYDEHTEFFYFTSISEQKLYNSARNIEIAAWSVDLS